MSHKSNTQLNKHRLQNRPLLKNRLSVKLYQNQNHTTDCHTAFSEQYPQTEQRKKFTRSNEMAIILSPRTITITDSPLRLKSLLFGSDLFVVQKMQHVCDGDSEKTEVKSSRENQNIKTASKSDTMTHFRTS